MHTLEESIQAEVVLDEVVLNKEDLTPCLSSYQGMESFRGCLEGIGSGLGLVRVLGQYVQFNSVFGGGVANLAGEIAVRQDLFRDRCAAPLISDRSAEVAAEIFFAAIDEFGSGSRVGLTTHRTLAQTTLKAAACFFGCDDVLLGTIARPSNETMVAIQKVQEGYGVNRTIREEGLFNGIGFHIASELLADGEFRLLDNYLSGFHPQLVQHLTETRVEAGRARFSAYQWISVHTSVESDHFDASLLGANLALKYYAGSEDPRQVKTWILNGVTTFARVQEDFMGHLCQGIAMNKEKRQ